MKVFIAVFLIVAGVFAYLWEQTASDRLGYKVGELQSEYDALCAENEAYGFKIQSAHGLANADKIAKEKNLHIPDGASIIYVDEKS